MNRLFRTAGLLGLLALPDAEASETPNSKKPKARESKVFVKAYGFYGLMAPGSFRGQVTNSLTTPSGTVDSFNETKPLGLGPRYGVGIGFIASPFINVGLDVDYAKPTDVVVTINDNTSDATFNYTSRLNQTLRYDFVSVIPNITLKAINTSSYYIYTRLGVAVVMPLTFQLDDTASETTSRITNSTVTRERTTVSSTTYSANTSLGFQAALGIQFSAGEKLRVFGEVVYNTFTFMPTKSTTELDLFFGNTTTTPVHSTAETAYQKQGQLTGNVSPQLRLPVNSLGLAVGLAFRF